MVEYNFLKNNESNFPDIDTVNVYQYDNDFDYGRYDASQMHLIICTVPWDVGEAHIGARTISGIGNVVYFGSKANRDKYFASIPDDQCYRFDSKYKALHRDMYIDVPIPFDMCAKHNYLVVEYELFANKNSPVEYEETTGHRKWFWFIREVEFLAPNTTRLHLLDDAFQTWIYDINVSGMILERGHAPMFATRTDAYLSNPLANNQNLLTEDVNFGDATQVKHIDALGLNAGTMYACIATTAYVPGSWGTKAADTWHVPTSSYYTKDGVPSVYVFACAVSDLNTLLANIDSSYPQMKQTIQAVFFASGDLITLGTSFSFASVTCYPISASRKTLDLTKLTKSMFGYGTRYQDIAKLYTSPYAHIEVTDENGQSDFIKIEDTTGDINVSAALSIAYPFITLEAHLTGVGGTSGATVTFKNISSHSFPVSGRWYETLRTWQIPTFAVVLSPATEYDYSSHFDRIQQANENAKTKTNADASANTALADATDSANTLVANADLQTATNTAITSASNTSVSSSVTVSNTHNQAMTSAANWIIDLNATSTIQAAEQQAAIGAVSSVVNGATGAIASGNPAGAVASVIGGVVGAAATMANMTVANALTATQATNAKVSNSMSSTGAQAKTSADGTVQQTAATSITEANNSYTSGSAANNAALQIGNATRDNTTALANNARDYNTAQSAIANEIAQAALRAPFMYGNFANGETATTKPIALFAHVVTQSKAAIESAGDEFLRYGYALDKQWDFNGNWNVGKYFTYWKLRDFWVSNLNVPDMYMDKIRFFLFGGVTVWRNPDDIGKRTVYENFN